MFFHFSLGFLGFCRVIRISFRELSKVFVLLGSLGLPFSTKFCTMVAALGFPIAFCGCDDISNFLRHLWKHQGTRLNLKLKLQNEIFVDALSSRL